MTEVKQFIATLCLFFDKSGRYTFTLGYANHIYDWDRFCRFKNEIVLRDAKNKGITRVLTENPRILKLTLKANDETITRHLKKFRDEAKPQLKEQEPVNESLGDKAVGFFKGLLGL